ncbi:polysaccharide deacetylase family protein [Halioxenophilus aromaticivorans]|uniref:DUF2334 domain-containing protein n=1 Tax=Halioxenophilus aromaticivorans TaxID=1306992 RepID=A0AAV3U9Q6_9ALTE
MKSLLSIHDLMPDTLKRVQDICRRLEALSVPADKVYLLVVPGLAWRPAQIQALHALQNQGYRLAGHGWYHHIHKKTSLKHYLHSAFISRNVAEHLSLSQAEITDMIARNNEWFDEQNLRVPELYVPPAWAMGKMTPAQLQTLPFQYYEYSSGLLHAPTGAFKALPLTGYEADRLWRVPVLWSWNQINVRWLAKSTPLRISIHPYDFDYHLKSSITEHIKLTDEFVDCAQVFG